MLWRIPATSHQQQLFLAEVIREVQFVVWTSVSTQVTTHNYIISLRVFSLAKSLSGPPQEPRAKVVQNYVKIDSQVENQGNIKWLTGSEGKLSPKLPMRFMFHALSNGMGWK